MSKENVDTVRRNVDGWNRGDVDAWLETFHPEIEWSSAIARQVEGDETVWRGPAEMRRFWDDLHSLWNHRIEVSEIRDRGDTIVALGRIQTRGKASGVELDSPVAGPSKLSGCSSRPRTASSPPSLNWCTDRALLACGHSRIARNSAARRLRPRA
jgi:ketosteroid isomerase-like protein